MVMSTNGFRFLVIASLLLLLVSGPVGIVLVDTLPPELRSFVILGIDRPFGFIACSALTVLLAFVVAHIGLLMFAWWSRPLFVLCVACSAAFTSVDGPYVMTGIESSISGIGALLDGAILALVFVSPLNRYFRKRNRVLTEGSTGPTLSS